MKISELPDSIRKKVAKGMVIPAHPLALTETRALDEKHQRALTRYYIDAGSGGLAVGVHTTQFEIRDPKFALYKPVLELASETADSWARPQGGGIFKVAGICGGTPQAVQEAEWACEQGYHAGLLSLGALRKESISELLDHCREIAAILPVFGFYLQPAVGGRYLPHAFWRGFAEIDNVIAIKVAAFNRYQTLDVIRGVCEAGRENEIALYTGNDDNILVDLLTRYRIQTGGKERSLRFVGGLLGHWAVWTRNAVQQFQGLRELVENDKPIPPDTLTQAVEVMDANAAFFDAANDFSGCIPGIHEVLRRQGLLKGNWCLNPDQVLSPGQSHEIDRVYKSYPHLNDDAFVKENLDRWLRD